MSRSPLLDAFPGIENEEERILDSPMPEGMFAAMLADDDWVLTESERQRFVEAMFSDEAPPPALVKLMSRMKP